jgi:hypothetical protein
MKTRNILILLLAVFSFSGQSQSLYVRAGLGAAICTAPHMIYQLTDNESEHLTESKRGGLGNGLPIMAAVGYYLGDNLGIELGVNYFSGFNAKTVNNSAGLIVTDKEHGSMLSIVPALVMRIKGDKLQPYARLGLMIGVLNSEKFDTQVSGLSSGERISKDYGGISIGAQAALGTEFKLSDLLSLFGEINIDAISWAPTKGKYTKVNEDGVDQLGSMTTKEKSWVYTKSYDSSVPIADSDPSKTALVNYSFTNAGLVIGVKINFGK